MFTFLHAADIHLDSPLHGLQRYEGAPVDEIRHATRRALENLVDLALQRAAAFVLVAGDLYDGDWREFRTGLFFVKQMARLREAGVRVFIVAGNHDAANRMTRQLPLPDNVHVLSADRPETVTLDDPPVAIHGQSFARAAVRENLAAAYPRRVSGLFNVGLLHTCAEGREGHEPYAPCSLDDLRSKHYDYWALGHVHRRETLQAETPAVFPGNLQGRHARESGPKGCMVVTVDEHWAAQARFQALDVFRWSICRVDVAGLEGRDEVLDRVQAELATAAASSDDRPLAARVLLVGPCPAHRQLAAEPHRLTNDIRALAQTVTGVDLWVEKVIDQTTPKQQPPPAAEGPIGELARYVAELKSDPEQLRQLAGQLSDLAAKLPPELDEGPEALRLGDPESLRGMIDQVHELLLHRLLGPEKG
ncbi:MAG TPA: DNA repair exonuclease [Planctomycetaceae bacterium]|nr:DNA repair exonuclease [Planctomycetaceae bacterium]HIQ22696.1 DNA repair exonuclease [Planctomycetota bacterium]